VNDAVSFDLLFERHLDDLYTTALRLTRSREAADDLIQETALKAFRNFGSLRSPDHARGWLYRILMNLFLNGRRKKQREREIPEEEVPETAAEEPSPEDLALLRESNGDVARVLESLPLDFRAVVWLSDVEGFSDQEIAVMIGCPAGTVASRLHRGRALFRGRFLALKGEENDKIVSLKSWKR
jgi:RNA polymerase sigma-70 factor (ECF subfamily)